MNLVCKAGHSFDLDESTVDIDLIGAILTCPFVLAGGSICSGLIVWKRGKLVSSGGLTNENK